jgi:hypothetical protein
MKPQQSRLALALFCALAITSSVFAKDSNDKYLRRQNNGEENNDIFATRLLQVRFFIA